MNSSKLFGCILAIILLSVAPSAVATPSMAPELDATFVTFLPLVQDGTPSMVSEVLALVNQHRLEAGCGPLQLNPQLTTAAQLHSEDMGRTGRVSHIGSNGSTFGERIKATGYVYSRAAENVAAGQSSAQSVMAAWMNSAGHRTNILNCNYVHIGIGYYFSGTQPYYHYWTQDFASPL
jgi:uncharacterized protein YkwD